ncbi:hypothetical protein YASMINEVIRUS_466 [Yasminevirus sp. GU-2018]|uniref:Uncharacterized protein n=1 Tax=Yasminevirus sp. GU-2018 TaxID=2420051 RepID=A0A5K0U9E3_9VIRU|nr:hypothetical protein YASMINEVIRUS_466 [Yasminevirus sp. GU-2018]
MTSSSTRDTTKDLRNLFAKYHVRKTVTNQKSRELIFRLAEDLEQEKKRGRKMLKDCLEQTRKHQKEFDREQQITKQKNANLTKQLEDTHKKLKNTEKTIEDLKAQLNQMRTVSQTESISRKRKNIDETVPANDPVPTNGSVSAVQKKQKTDQPGTFSVFGNPRDSSKTFPFGSVFQGMSCASSNVRSVFAQPATQNQFASIQKPFAVEQATRTGDQTSNQISYFQMPATTTKSTFELRTITPVGKKSVFTS